MEGCLHSVTEVTRGAMKAYFDAKIRGAEEEDLQDRKKARDDFLEMAEDLREELLHLKCQHRSTVGSLHEEFCLFMSLDVVVDQLRETR